MEKPSSESTGTQLEKYAANAAEKVVVSQPGQLPEGLTLLGAVGSLGYYLADFTEYFVTGPTPTEVPLYLAFLALSGVAVSILRNICGRQDRKTQLKGVVAGGTGGFGIGAGIAGIALGLAADIFTMGGTTIAGGLIGYLSTRRGRKVHKRCGQKLHCDTWICTKCKHIIVPAKDWPNKDRWNLLDVADYLDTGGLEMDSLQALAFMEHAGLYKDVLKIQGFPPTWDPKRVRAAATNPEVVENFGRMWGEFATATHLYAKPYDNKAIENALKLWGEFRVEAINKSTSRRQGNGGPLSN